MRDAYTDLIQRFLTGLLTGPQFEKQYLAQFKRDDTLTGDRFRILDKLFADVDGYCADPELRDGSEFEIGDDELRKLAAEALQQLVELDTAALRK